MTERGHVTHAGAVLFLLLALTVCSPAGAESPIVRLHWALLYEEAGGVLRAIDYARSIVELRSGDRFKILVKPASSCFLYLFLHDSQQELSVLFPEGFATSEHALRADRRYRLPAPERWYYLDDKPGVETLYLIASPERLRRLEARAEEHQRRRSRPESAQAIETKYEVLDEIKRMINESSSLSSKAERPVAVAGDVRGITDEDSLSGLEVVTRGVYVRTIRLRH